MIYITEIIIFLINIIILIGNIYLSLKSTDNKYSQFEFKSSDNFTFFISKKLYKSVYKDNIVKKNQKIKVSVNFVDSVPKGYNYEILKNWFKNQPNFILENNTENPDFLFYDVWGKNHSNRKYNKSVKIAVYSENCIPDLHFADYAIGQAHIMYLNRYFKYPVFITELNKFNVYNIKRIKKISTKKKFCIAVISNKRNYTYFRLNFIHKLNNYKKIDMGGRAFNNIGKLVKDKIEFLSDYKFSISMENTEGDGYVSEKIIDSFIAGTIPIYYGDYMIDEYINNKAFILIKGEKDIDKKI